jgi:hypothetical protein
LKKDDNDVVIFDVEDGDNNNGDNNDAMNNGGVSNDSAPDDGIKDNGAFDDEIIVVGGHNKKVKDNGTPLDRDNKDGNNNDGNTGIDKLIIYEVKKEKLDSTKKKKVSATKRMATRKSSGL